MQMHGQNSASHTQIELRTLILNPYVSYELCVLVFQVQYLTHLDS